MALCSWAASGVDTQRHSRRDKSPASAAGTGPSAAPEGFRDVRTRRGRAAVPLPVPRTLEDSEDATS